LNMEGGKKNTDLDTEDRAQPSCFLLSEGKKGRGGTYVMLIFPEEEKELISGEGEKEHSGSLAPGCRAGKRRGNVSPSFLPHKKEEKKTNFRGWGRRKSRDVPSVFLEKEGKKRGPSSPIEGRKGTGAGKGETPQRRKGGKTEALPQLQKKGRGKSR